PPALEVSRVAEARALQMVVADLAHELEPDRFPRQILAAIPPAGRAGHALLAILPLGPFAPGMTVARAISQRLQQLGELRAHLLLERRGDADVMQHALAVVEPEQQRADELVLAALVPAKAADHAVGGARVLDLQHRALARRVRERLGLGDHAVEP